MIVGEIKTIGIEFNTTPIEKVSVGLFGIMNRGKAFIRMFD